MQEFRSVVTPEWPAENVRASKVSASKNIVLMTFHACIMLS